MKVLDDMILALLILIPFAGAAASYLIGRRSKQARDITVLAVCALQTALSVSALVLSCTGHVLHMEIADLCGLGIRLTCDGFRGVYITIASFMWLLSQGVFAPKYFAHHYRNRNRYYLFTLITLGATTGMFLSSSLFSAFVFFEIMSLCSYPWVAHEENEGAMKAAETYLAVAVIGGMVSLMGMFLLYDMTGTLDIDKLKTACEAVENKKRLLTSGILIAVGFAAKAGAFPFHIWLPKAHPVAPAPASALLSGMLTKTGVFGMIAVTGAVLYWSEAWGNLLLACGIVTMFVGALLALFSVDLKRTLACSSMSQIGFILTGLSMAALLGEEGSLAIHGTMLHMVNHSLIKLVLFMAAGSVYMQVHKLNLNDIRGIGRKQPVLNFAFLMGYLGIIGMPLWNGFISKSLIHEGILEYVEVLSEEGLSIFWYKASEYIFLLTGGMTAAYMTKLYVTLFVMKNTKDVQKEYDKLKLPAAVKAALLISAVVLPVLGVTANFSMNGIAVTMQGILGGEAGYGAQYFNFENLKGAAISLIIGAVLYFTVVKKLLMTRDNKQGMLWIDRKPDWFDLEKVFYRPLLEKLLPGILHPLAVCMDRLTDIARTCLNFIGTLGARAMDGLVDGLTERLWRTLFKEKRKKTVIATGNRFTYTLGKLFDGLVSLLNRTFFRRRPIEMRDSFVYIFAAGFSEMGAEVRRIALSISFGLLLLCIGLCIVFIYIL